MNGWGFCGDGGSRTRVQSIAQSGYHTHPR